MSSENIKLAILSINEKQNSINTKIPENFVGATAKFLQGSTLFFDLMGLHAFDLSLESALKSLCSDENIDRLTADIEAYYPCIYSRGNIYYTLSHVAQPKEEFIGFNVVFSIHKQNVKERQVHAKSTRLTLPVQDLRDYFSDTDNLQMSVLFDLYHEVTARNDFFDLSFVESKMLLDFCHTSSCLIKHENGQYVLYVLNYKTIKRYGTESFLLSKSLTDKIDRLREMHSVIYHTITWATQFLFISRGGNKFTNASFIMYFRTEIKNACGNLPRPFLAKQQNLYGINGLRHAIITNKRKRSTTTEDLIKISRSCMHAPVTNQLYVNQQDPNGYDEPVHS